MLGVAPTATAEEVRAAYIRSARSHHPDAGGSHVRMREVTEAWAVLGEARSRRAYDLFLGVARVGDESARDEAPDDLAADRDDLDDLDDRPIRPTPPSHGVLAVAPVALFAVSVLVGIMAMMLTNRVLLGTAGALFAVAAGLMIAVPLIEMARGSARRSR